MKYFKKLVGKRIYLSPRNSEDLEKFTEWLNDFEITDYLGRSGMLVSLDGEKQYLEKNNNPEASFVIVTLDNDEMIGTVSLEKIDNINRSATLGIFSDIAKEFGPDSYIAKLAAIMVGSSETTFYVLAVYFGSVGIKKFRHALCAGIFADIIGIVVAVAVARWLFL